MDIFLKIYHSFSQSIEMIPNFEYCLEENTWDAYVCRRTKGLQFAIVVYRRMT